MKPREAILFGLASVLALAGWWLSLSPRASSAAATAAPAPSGTNRLLGLNPRQDPLDVLEKLAWSDVAPTADAALADTFVRDRIAAETSAIKSTPLAYLRGLLLLAQNKPAAALESFSAIPPAEIPLDLLYAPYRLHGDLRRDTPNPFAARLREAARRGEPGPLVAARVLAAEGAAREAVENYLKTDPARWTSHDIGLLGVFLAHDAHRATVSALLQAALRGGRVQERLKPPLLRTLASAAAHEHAVPLGVKEAMLRDPEVRDALVAGAAAQLEARRLFRSGKDAELLAAHAGRPSDNASDELLLLLTLSAARHRDRAAFDKWSAALGGRDPRPEVLAWISGLYPPAKN